MKKHNLNKGTRRILLSLILIFAFAVADSAQTTSFTYQGRLTDGGNPANGNYDLQFALFDAAAGGAQIGAMQTVSAVSVSGGVFTVRLDFGVSAFTGANRFLEISVRPAGSGNYVTLAPRQQISSTPYAIRTLSAAQADTATDAQKLGGVAASQYVRTDDPRLGGSANNNYIQNTTTQQAANLNISGSGIFGGNIGIGTTNPTQRLHIFSPDARLLLQATSDSAYAVTAYKTNTKLYDVGIGGASTPFVANKFYIYDYTASQHRFVVDTNGNIGVGTTTPTAAKLQVNDTSVGTAVYGTTSTTGSGVFGENTGGGWAVYANGNAGQALDKGGFVKAAMLVEENGQISLCYNSQVTGTFANTPLCGFSVTHVNNINGFYQITFPFAVNNRFFSVTPASSPNGNTTNRVFPQVRPINSTTINVLLFTNSGDFPAPFYLIVY